MSTETDGTDSIGTDSKSSIWSRQAPRAVPRCAVACCCCKLFVIASSLKDKC